MQNLLSSTLVAIALTLPVTGHAETARNTVTIEPLAGQSPQIEVATADLLDAPLYVDPQGAAGNQGLFQGVADPLQTWETLARIEDIRTDADDHVDAFLVSTEDDEGDRLLTLQDVTLVRDTDAPDQVFVLFSGTAETFSRMPPFVQETVRGGDDMRWASDRFARSTPYGAGDVSAEDAIGMTLYAGSRTETERGLFDFSNAPANWTALGVIEDVAESGGATEAFILQSGAILGIGGTEDRIAPGDVAFLRNTEGRLYAIYTGPRDAFPERLDAVDR